MPVGRGAGSYSVGVEAYCFRSPPPSRPPTHGHFVLFPGLARTKKTRWRPLELKDRSLRLNGKIDYVYGQLENRE